MKHLIKLAFLLLALLLPATATAHDFMVNGIYYKILNDNEVEVTYQGASYDSYSNEYFGTVTIPSSVTCSGKTYSVNSIGKNAFRGCSVLTSITIPNSVTAIGHSAFRDCSGLIDVSIPSSVTTIDFLVFYNCSKLNEVYSYIDDVSSISMGGSVFYRDANNYGVRTLYVPAGALSDYQEDTNWSQYFGSIVEMNNDTDTISFADANVKALCVQNWDLNGDGRLSKTEAASVTDIGTVFKDNSSITSFDELQYFTGLNSIWHEAFSNCSGLTSISIPSGVTAIGVYAFNGCSKLTNITIPSNVTIIEDMAFYNCCGLINISIPNSVATIGYSAFYNCSGLTSITIPNLVTYIGEGAFDGCTALETVNYNAVSCDDFIEFGTLPFSNLNISTINIGDSVQRIPARFALGLKNISTVEIPNSVITIGKLAFADCSGLTSMNIPNSVTSIGNYAYAGCSGLTSLDLPGSVTYINEGAFCNCSGLTSVTIPNSVASIGDYAFSDCI